jgi:hypothetical protein
MSFRRKPESSLFKTFWMPPYQIRGKLLKSGMTDKDIYGQTLINAPCPEGGLACTKAWAGGLEP